LQVMFGHQEGLNLSIPNAAGSIMNTSVCLSANTLAYAHGGGHLSVYLNWAMGFREAGCDVIWLEAVNPAAPGEETLACIAALETRLQRYQLDDRLALCSASGEALPAVVAERHPAACQPVEADVLFNMRYTTRPRRAGRFKVTAFLDIDPGLLQTWVSKYQLDVAPHDVYFTIGETVGRTGARFPDAGLPWTYTPPCVSLEWWQPHGADPDAAFSTVTHWHASEWIEENGQVYANDKRTAFLPFLSLPKKTKNPLELALCLSEKDHGEWQMLRRHGWRVCNAFTKLSTPWNYQRFIQRSRGEFSCAKPAYVRLQTAWISDRTLCYLASGKPAIVQHTGPSRFLPEAEGLFRFRNLEEAACCLEVVASDYGRHAAQARALAERHFDAKMVTTRILERLL